MNNNLSILNSRIKEFIKKYYLNKLFKGAIFFILITLLVFIFFAVLEYFSFFSTIVRTVLFYSYLLLFTFTLVFYVIIPLLKISGLGKQITRKQVAQIVGKHFGEVDDKLLNIIQLEEQLEAGDFKSYQLLLAAIDTKINQIKPFSFVKAIPFRKTTRYIKWAMIPIFLFVLIFSFQKEIITESAARIVRHNQYFEKPAPYSFEIVNEDLTAFQNEDYTLHVKVIGEETPKELYILLNNRNFKLTKISNTEFSYTFTKVQRNTNFQLTTDEVTSKLYTITVLPKPVTISFVMQLNYPSYLNKNNETVNNHGDVTVPEGTTITWKFYTKNTDTVSFIYQDQQKCFSPKEDQTSFSLTARAPFDYAVINSNQYFTSQDTIKHAVFVIKDQYPEIAVESQQDSFFMDRIYFKGNIKDDYGFSGLKFVYSKFDSKGNLLESEKSVNIEYNRQVSIQDFYYYFDAGTLQLEPGYKVEYYFEVRDNDAINGYKPTRSSSYSYRVKTMEEVDKELENSSNQAKSEMDDLLKESNQLIKDIDKLNKQMMQVNNPSWQDKKKLEALIEQYKELQNKVNQVKQQQEQQSVLEQQFKNTPEDLLKKQQELQNRMENILSDEMKNMMEKMQQMMNELNKDQMKDAMDQMKMSAEDINKSLDQQLQLYKQLEFEKKVNDIAEKAKKLADEERLLSKESQQKALKKEELISKQQDIQKKFEDLKQEIKNLEQLNKELEDPNKMTNTEDLQKKIENAMKEGNEALNKNNRDKASEKQKESADDMEKLADQMEMDLLDSQEEDLAEDIETMRQLLDNLVKVSFQQEDNMTVLKSLNARSSRLTEVIRDQFSIQDHARMIDDTLSALARRQPKVQPFVLKEVTKIRDYLAQAQNNLAERRLPQTLSNQQFIMTSMNNLALMLAESMKEMNKQMGDCKNCKNAKSGKQSKPGSGSKSGKSAKSARELQQQLNRQMEAMKRSMEQQQQGGNNPGSQGEGGMQQQMSEQLAKMAAQQEAIRKMMQDMQGEMKSQNGVGDKALDKMIKDMEETEKDLVNRVISQQTLNRQKNIETRLLESEKADLQREKEEKRESKEARDILNLNPPKEWKMDKLSEKQNEMLKTVPLNLNYYYKEKVNQYFLNIE